MSYDFSIEIDTGGSEPHLIEPYFADELAALAGNGGGMTAIVTTTGYARCGNYTSNVSGMWIRCLEGALERVPAGQRARYASWRGDDERALRIRAPHLADHPIEPYLETLSLRDLADKHAGELVPLLRAAVEWGVEHIDELREKNPPNGWGDAEGAVTYLWDIQRMCEQHPNGRLSISS